MTRGSPTPRPQALRLPDMDVRSLPAAGLVSRATSIVLWVMGALVIAGFAAAALVSMDITVRTAGTLHPLRVLPVRPPVAGAISAVHVRTGSRVATGDVVIVLDSLTVAAQESRLRGQHATLLAEQRRLEASLPVDELRARNVADQADAQLLRARAALRERMTLFSVTGDVDSIVAHVKPGSHVGLDLAIADVRTAMAARRAAVADSLAVGLRVYDLRRLTAEAAHLRDELALVAEQRERLRLVAPGDGVVLTEGLDRLAGSWHEPGVTLLEIADVESWQVTAYVRERDVHEIGIGDSVTIEVPALGRLKRHALRGAVTSVAHEITATPIGTDASAPGHQAGGFRVLIAVSTHEIARIGAERLRRGYTVDARIVTRREKVGIVIRDFVRRSLSGG